MVWLNLIPIALLAWFVYRAWSQAQQSDHADHYFQVNKNMTGQKFCNWFGIPKQPS
ncbi:MAG: hypothetical protein HQL58_07470 [Magnetococcales bacterium]|nr:hypothetical protein [Magnetococcales bacterium]